MKITKKEIARNTIVKKGEGFNPYYSFRCTIIKDKRTYVFYKEMGQDAIYLEVKNEVGLVTFKENRTALVFNKKQFIDTVYGYVNFC